MTILNYLLDVLRAMNHFLWGPVMLVLIGGTGLYLTLGLRLITFRRFKTAFAYFFKGRRSQEEGDISPFNALMTSLSATIGTGNIAGVATAVFMGGPGAIFWMWCVALVGMATKFAEAVCAVHYREVDANGDHVGGPMYYIKNGLHKHYSSLGVMFAFFGMMAGFGSGNMVQSNSITQAVDTIYDLPPWVPAGVLTILAGLVLIGGIRRIAHVAGRVVPFMIVAYLGVSLYVMLINITDIPQAILFIVHSAFHPAAAAGGFAGATIWAAMRFGVARGIFSNEAGLGSAAIAHAAAKTTQPVRQGMIAMLGPFIDTILICTMTALVITLSGAWQSGDNGAAMSIDAYDFFLPSIGHHLVTLALIVFAFTTILGWSFYSEKCIEFLFGVRAIKPFRVAWVIAIPIGCYFPINAVWLLADTLNAMMAIPNLIALLLLSPVIFKLSNNYFSKLKQRRQTATVELKPNSEL